MKDVAILRKVSGSCYASFDPGMSEWGNPSKVILRNLMVSKVAIKERTQGTETSKYLQEKKSQRFR